MPAAAQYAAQADLNLIGSVARAVLATLCIVAQHLGQRRSGLAEALGIGPHFEIARIAENQVEFLVEYPESLA